MLDENGASFLPVDQMGEISVGVGLRHRRNKQELYAPMIPMIRIGLRGRLPQRQIDQVFMGAVGMALAHAGYIMFSDSSV